MAAVSKASYILPLFFCVSVFNVFLVSVRIWMDVCVFDLHKKSNWNELFV